MNLSSSKFSTGFASANPICPDSLPQDFQSTVLVGGHVYIGGEGSLKEYLSCEMHLSSGKDEEHQEAKNNSLRNRKNKPESLGEDILKTNSEKFIMEWLRVQPRGNLEKSVTSFSNAIPLIIQLAEHNSNLKSRFLGSSAPDMSNGKESRKP